jgi:hypothetical protein
LDAEGRKAQGERSVEAADESVTDSVILFNQRPQAAAERTIERQVVDP